MISSSSCATACRFSRRRAGWLAATLTTTLTTLTLCLSLLVAGCASSGAPAGARTTSVGTPTHAPSSPTVITSPATPGWSQFSDPTYGFVTQYPNDATFNGPPPQGLVSSDGWLITNPQNSADDASLEVSATPQPDASLCAHYRDGKPVMVAGDITGYEQDTLNAPTPPPGAAAQPQITVLFSHGGLFYIITLTAAPPGETVLQRWGAVWGHILATFQPGQGPASAHPCG